MKLEEILNSELGQLDIDWKTYLEDINGILPENEIKYLFEAGKRFLCRPKQKYLFKDMLQEDPLAKEYFEYIQIILKNHKPINFNNFIETSKYLLQNNKDIINTVITEQKISFEMWWNFLKELNPLLEYTYQKKQFFSLEIQRWDNLSKEDILKLLTLSKDDLVKIFTEYEDFEYTQTPHTPYAHSLIYSLIRNAPDVIDKINLDEWIDLVKKIYEKVPPDIFQECQDGDYGDGFYTPDYFESTCEIIKQGKTNFKDWVNFGCACTPISSEHFSNFEDWHQYQQYKKKIEQFQRVYFTCTSDEYQQNKSRIALSLAMKYFNFFIMKYEFKQMPIFLSHSFISKDELEKMMHGDTTWLFDEEFQFDEFEAFNQLLNHGKQTQFKINKYQEYTIKLAEKLEGNFEENGRNLFKQLYYGLKSNTRKLDSEYRSIINKIKGYNFQNRSGQTNLREGIIAVFDEKLKDIDFKKIDKNRITESIDMIKKIYFLIKKNNENHDIIDFFDLISSYLSEVKTLTKIRLETHKQFTDDLCDNRSLYSCVFGPDGIEREACLQYALDPDIELVFLSTYFEDKFQQNIAVGYLINTKDSKTGEKVWVLDGVDAGPLVRKIPHWMDFLYDGLIDLVKNAENPPDKFVANVNVGKKPVPNSFLEHICKKKGLIKEKDYMKRKLDETKRGESLIEINEKNPQKKSAILHKPLLSESNPEAYNAIGTNLSYLDAWYKSSGNKAWNEGRGEVDVIELMDLRGAE